jgi:LAO/AO transport system kinase
MDLVDGILKADSRSMARALSIIESGGHQAQEILKGIFSKTGRGVVIGVTGPPGSGKSTLVDKLAQAYRKQSKSVGIVAVDPTSPFTGGAILADRIRMQNLYNDEGVFIRSMATRGHLGGLAWATRDAVSVLDAAGKEIILVETVGVGQDEIEVVRLADVSVVLLVPGMGDELQALKAGIMEIADVFVINKADRPQVERFQQELESVLSLCVRPDNWKPLVLKTIATEDQGVLEVIEAIASYTQFRASHPEFAESRRYETEEDILALLKEQLLTRVLEQEGVRDKVRVATQAVRARKMDPYTAVEQIVEQLHKPGVAGPAR